VGSPLPELLGGRGGLGQGALPTHGIPGTALRVSHPPGAQTPVTPGGDTPVTPLSIPSTPTGNSLSAAELTCGMILCLAR